MTKALQERDRMICKLRVKGVSTSAIAARVGVTRSTVCGVLYRNGLTHMPTAKPVLPAVKKVDRRRNFPIQKARMKPLKVEETMKALALEPLPLGIEGGCQWIRGIANDRVFCGHKTHRQSSWCEHHYNRVFIRAN